MSDPVVQQAQKDEPAASVQELLARYCAGPGALEAEVRGMTSGQLRAYPVAGKWSTLDAICHIGDAEQFFADRIKRTLAMDRPLLMGADAPSYREPLQYAHRELHEELALVELTRSQVARILRHVPEQAWERSGVHSENGLVTVRQLVIYAIRHLDNHLAAIREKRKALGV